MRCPFCGEENSQVKDSRSTEDGAAIRRRRACSVCGGRFTTFERVQLRELTVVKRSNKREPFDRAKLERAVVIATRKRPVDEAVIDRMISGIVRQLESTGEGEVTAAHIGDLAMEALRLVDDVAYVRFASVYRNFSEAKDFEAFVADLAQTVSARQSSALPDPDDPA
ncbi:MAG: transcriptional regulator NrdR [Pseudomonadota bacterium]